MFWLAYLVFKIDYKQTTEETTFGLKPETILCKNQAKPSMYLVDNRIQEHSWSYNVAEYEAGQTLDQSWNDS